jgi:hypothetical protein
VREIRKTLKWQTVHMALAENARDFWLAAAAAAPVIALSGLVLITDSAVARDIIGRAKKEAPTPPDLTIGIQMLGPPSMWAIFYCIVTLLTQCFVLIAALFALLQDDTMISGILIIVVEIIGLVFLLLAAVLTGQAGVIRQRWEEWRASKDAEKLAGAIASRVQVASVGCKTHETAAAEASEKKREGTAGA